MKYFNTPDGVRAIEPGQEFLIETDWTELTQAEVDALLNPVQSPEELQASARGQREGELIAADFVINDLEDRGQDASAWRAYRVALRDMTLDAAWGTDPLGVVSAAIAGKPV